MTIDPMKLDNPIAFEAVPTQPLTVQFPARPVPAPPVPSLDGEKPRSIAAFLINNFLIQTLFGVAFLALHSYPNLAKYLIQFERTGVIVLAIVLLMRLCIQISDLYSVVYFVALVVGANCFASAVLARQRNAAVFQLFASLLLAWPCLEIGLHYSSIANKMLMRPTENDKDFVKRDSSFLLYWTIISLLCVHVSLDSSHRTFAIAIIAGLNIAVGVVSAKKNSQSSAMLINTAVFSFLRYPNAYRLPPGLIATISGPIDYRVACINMPMFGLIAIRMIDRESINQYFETVSWVLVSITLTYSYVILAAGKLVRPEMLNPSKGPWDMVVEQMHRSPNPHERNSYFNGFVHADNSPILIERSLFDQPVHFLGNAGCGKTAVGLAPTIEQTILFGDTRLCVIDLKADTLELLATCMAARETYKERTGIELPIRVFTLEQGDMSHAFNPFTTPGWQTLSLSDRSSILCASLGLFYGFDYARQYFSAENADVIDECFNANPSVESFYELLDTLNDLIEDRSSYMSEKRRSSYVHVVQILSKLASCNMLNVTKNSGASQEVLDNQINLAEAFEQPGIYYFHLPSITSPVLAPSIARLVAQFLIVAGRATKRTTKVQLVIDEFQRMISENLDQFFQMARSMDVGLVLANQSLMDLKASGLKLYQAIEGNCNVRQWISATSTEDLQAIQYLFGEQKEVKEAVSHTHGGKLYTQTLESAPRITITDLHTIFDDPSLSVIKITGTRKGYARYRGIPFVMRSHFHITEAEYKRRRAFEWPSDLPNTMEVRETPITRKPKAKSGGGSRPTMDKPKNKGLDQPIWDQDLFS